MLTDAPRPPNSDPLRQGVHTLRGVGEYRLEQLHRLGIITVGDLLFHFPRAYEDLSDHRPITALTEGTIQTVHGEVVEIPDGRHLPNGRSMVSIATRKAEPVNFWQKVQWQIVTRSGAVVTW